MIAGYDAWAAAERAKLLLARQRAVTALGGEPSFSALRELLGQVKQGTLPPDAFAQAALSDLFFGTDGNGDELRPHAETESETETETETVILALALALTLALVLTQALAPALNLSLSLTLTLSLILTLTLLRSRGRRRRRRRSSSSSFAHCRTRGSSCATSCFRR